MKVKKFWAKFVNERKNLKVAPQVHRQVEVAAVNANVPIYLYTEAVIAVGMKHDKEVRKLLDEQLAEPKGKR